MCAGRRAISEAGGNCVLRADGLALPAAHAFGVVLLRAGVHLHRAGARAVAAGDAAALGDFVAVNCHAVKERVNRAQGADVFAKRAVNQHGEEHRHRQNQELPLEQRAHRPLQRLVGQHQRNARLQGARRANPLAECRRAVPHCVRHKERQENDKHQQDDIFQEAQGLVQAKGLDFLGKGYLVQQLLHQPEGAEKAADEAPEKGACQQEKARQIVGKGEGRAAQHRLHRPNGAGAEAAGAGIAV